MPLSKQEKQILYTGVALLTGVTILGIVLSSDKKKELKPKKKTYGITVSEQCNSYEINSEQDIHDTLRAIIREEAKRGPVDPFAVARGYVKKAAPHCRSYPENSRSPGEAELFVRIFNEGLDVMVSESLLSASQVASFHEMVKAWGIGQGIPPSEF